MNCKPFPSTPNLCDSIGWINHNYLFHGCFDIFNKEIETDRFQVPLSRPNCNTSKINPFETPSSMLCMCRCLNLGSEKNLNQLSNATLNRTNDLLIFPCRQLPNILEKQSTSPKYITVKVNVIKRDFKISKGTDCNINKSDFSEAKSMQMECNSKQGEFSACLEDTSPVSPDCKKADESKEIDGIPPAQILPSNNQRVNETQNCGIQKDSLQIQQTCGIPPEDNSLFSFKPIAFEEEVKQTCPETISNKSEDLFDDVDCGKLKIKGSAERTDIVAKSLIRSIKRYYSSLCGIDDKPIYSKDTKRIEDTLDKIDEICVINFKDIFSLDVCMKSPKLKNIIKAKGSPFVGLNQQEIYYLQVKVMVVCMVMRNCTKNILNKFDMKRTFIKFYDCIYKYSQRRLAKLMKVPAFKITFNQFISSGALREMVEKDKSLCKKGELLLKKAEDLQKYYLL